MIMLPRAIEAMCPGKTVYPFVCGQCSLPPRRVPSERHALRRSHHDVLSPRASRLWRQWQASPSTALRDGHAQLEPVISSLA